MSEPVNPINPPAENGYPADATLPPVDGNGAATRSCPTLETVGQLENRILAAAKVMEQCQAEVAKAEAEEQEAKVYLEKAQSETLAARARQIGKAFLLGAELDALYKEMAATKGKHRGDTFRKRAVKLLKNKNAVYRPLAIYRYLTKKGITSEEDAVFYAGESGESYRTLADIAQGAEQQSKAAKVVNKSGHTKPSVLKVVKDDADEDEFNEDNIDDDDDEAEEDDSEDDGTDGDTENEDDEYEPEPATDEVKRESANIFICQFETDSEAWVKVTYSPEPEAVQKAVAYLIGNYFVGGWKAARDWMASQGSEDFEIPEEELDDEDFEPVTLAAVDLADIEEESLD
jgi:hypothetical protein